MHLIRTFTHLQVRKIPEKYILKRYTKDARQEVEWDRHDGVQIGTQAGQEQTRLSKLLPKLMKLGRAGSKSNHAFDETNKQLDLITSGIEMYERSTGSTTAIQQATTHTAEDPADQSTAGIGSESTEHMHSDANTDSTPSFASLPEDILLIEPPVSRTKGRDTVREKKVNVEASTRGNPLSTYDKQNHGNRECSICGVRGTHYATTCPQNPNRSRAAETKANKKGSRLNGGPPRKRGQPQTVGDGSVIEEDGMSAAQTRATAEGGGSNWKWRYNNNEEWKESKASRLPRIKKYL